MERPTLSRPGRASFGITKLKTGKQDTASTALPLTAMLEEDGKWLIVSEYRPPSRNQLAATLMLKLEKSMTKSFETVSILNEKGKTTMLRKLIGSKINAAEGSEMRWQPRGHLMKGDMFDEPEIKGEVSVDAAGKPGAEPSRYAVVLGLVMKDDDLMVRTLAVNPVK